MVGAGLGLGVFLSTLTLVVQNAVPYTMLGVATGASRYLQQAGATLGIAMVGTVVNNTVSGDIRRICRPAPSSSPRRRFPRPPIRRC